MILCSASVFSTFVDISKAKTLFAGTSNDVEAFVRRYGKTLCICLVADGSAKEGVIEHHNAFQTIARWLQQKSSCFGKIQKYGEGPENNGFGWQSLYLKDATELRDLVFKAWSDWLRGSEAPLLADASAPSTQEACKRTKNTSAHSL